MIRKLGTFVEFSVMSEKATVDWTIIGDTKELDIRGSHLGPHCYPVAIRMLEQGMLPMESIVTHRFPLSDFAKAMDRVATHHGSMKVILEP
jgi:threonine dehydrogenase-like Zn-dependent dehydrogenase